MRYRRFFGGSIAVFLTIGFVAIPSVAQNDPLAFNRIDKSGRTGTWGVTAQQSTRIVDFSNIVDNGTAGRPLPAAIVLVQVERGAGGDPGSELIVQLKGRSGDGRVRVLQTWTVGHNTTGHRYMAVQRRRWIEISITGGSPTNNPDATGTWAIVH